MNPVTALYKALEEEGWNEAKRFSNPPRRFRCSELGGCPRQMFYRLSGFRPTPRDAKGKVYGIQGDADHDLARQMWEHYGTPIRGVVFDEDGNADEKMWVREDYERKVGDRTAHFTISGRGDGEVDTDEGVAYLEIKGMGFWYYKYLNEAWCKGYDAVMERLETKHPGYLLQCEAMMRMLGMERTYFVAKDRSSGTLGFFNEKTGERDGMIINRDDERWERLLDKLAGVMLAINDGEPPRRAYTAKSNECSWCPFRYRCHDADERRTMKKKPAVVYPGPQMNDIEGGGDIEDDTCGVERKDA